MVASLTQRLYLDDPDLLEFDAHVVDRRSKDGRDAVVLDRTAFYAESGGQPWDTGTLGDARVDKVVYEGDEILHFVDRPLPLAPVRGRVDAERRRDHMQQHHGQHLLSRTFEQAFGARTTSFHLGGAVSSIDLDREVSPADASAAESQVNEIVWAARPVSVRTVTRAEAQALGVHPAPEAGDAIRLVEAAGFDLQPCGGTHPRSTSAVGIVLICGQERYKAGSRIQFVCGHRAVGLWRLRRDLVARMGASLSAAPDALGDALERTLARLSDSDRRVRDLMKTLIDTEARRLAAAPAGSVVSATLEGWDVGDLRGLAQRIIGLAPVVVVLGSRGSTATLVAAQPTGGGADLRSALQTALGHIEGRGGGQPHLVQGQGPRVSGLDDAVAALVGALSPC